MTRAQESARMRKILDGIWRKGDRDECSEKHVNHCLAAIVTGGTWQDAVDYKRPWHYDHEDNMEGGSSQETDLTRRWAKVQDTYDRLGHDEFMAVIDPDNVPLAYNVEFYAGMYYGAEGEAKV